MKPIIHPRTGKPIPPKNPPEKRMSFPPENKNFRARFNMPHGRKIVKSTPALLEVVGSINPETFELDMAITLKFRDGLVISGGPIHMAPGGDDEQVSEGGVPGPSGDAPDPGDSEPA